MWAIISHQSRISEGGKRVFQSSDYVPRSRVLGIEDPRVSGVAIDENQETVSIVVPVNVDRVLDPWLLRRGNIGSRLRRGWSGLLTQLASVAETDHIIDQVVHSLPPVGSSEDSLHVNHTRMSFVSFMKDLKAQDDLGR